MPQNTYHFHRTESGAVYAAAGCRLVEADGFLVVSPDQRVAQFTSSIPHEGACCDPELARLLFWKGVLTFGQNLPVVREARMACEACGRWNPTGVYDPVQLCPTCRDHGRVETCLGCGREVRASSRLDQRCLPCWTVTSLLRRFGESPSLPRGSFDESGDPTPVKRAPAVRRSRRLIMVRAQVEDPDGSEESID